MRGESAAETGIDEEEDHPEALVIRLGGVEFGIALEHVREVLHLPVLTRLPFPPPSILGVVNVRGAIVPVLDLGDRLFGRPARRDGRLVLVTDPGGGGELGLLVDAVIDLIELGPGVETSPEIEHSLPDGWIDRVLAPRADRLVTVLDPGPVLSPQFPVDETSR